MPNLPDTLSVKQPYYGNCDDVSAVAEDRSEIGYSMMIGNQLKKKNEITESNDPPTSGSMLNSLNFTKSVT